MFGPRLNQNNIRWLLRLLAITMLSISGGAAAAQLFHKQPVSQVGHDAAKSAPAQLNAITNTVRVGPELLPVVLVGFLALSVQRQIFKLPNQGHKIFAPEIIFVNIAARAPPFKA